MARALRPSRPPPEPTEADLHEAALRYLARYAASVAGVVRMLERRIARWQRAAGAEAETVAKARVAARTVAARLARAGVLDDAAFAAARARTLGRAGRSRRAIAAHLAARGVDGEVARAVLPSDATHDLAAAAATLRRRRLGPFREAESDDPARARRDLAALARAGFGEALARRALGLSRTEAEDLLRRHRESGV